MASIIKRKEIPLLITGFCGFAMVLSYFINFDPLNYVAGTINGWITVLSGIVVGLGVIGLIIVHGNRIQKRTPGQWPFSLWLIIIMFVTMAAGWWAQVPWGLENQYWQLIYLYVQTPIQTTIFSLFGFYVISAAFHALRVKNLESLLFLITGTIIFFWAAPIGSAIWPGFATLGDWLMAAPTAGVFRGILLGASLGIVAFGLRLLIGRERGYLRTRSG